jgi:hypothetical protein
MGAAVFLLAPVTFWFAFFKLEQEGKEFPTTMWLFGLVSTIILTVVFWTPISYVATGRMDQLERPIGVAEAAVNEYGNADEAAQASDDAPAPESEPEPEPEETAPPSEEPAEQAATNGSTGTNQGGSEAATQ